MHDFVKNCNLDSCKIANFTLVYNLRVEAFDTNVMKSTLPDKWIHESSDDKTKVSITKCLL